MIKIKEVKTYKDKREFVKLPFDIYKNNKYWVPPIISDEIKTMDPAKNPAMEFSDTKSWIAFRNDKPVGRISAIINYKYLEKTGKKQGRFSKMELFDDDEVYNALMKTASSWLKEKGMTEIHGPLGYTNLDNQGLLIEGFDYLPSVASVYHLPYYKDFLENDGFKKEIDWLEFRLTLGEYAIKKALRGAEMIKKRYGFEVVRFKKTKEMLPYTEAMFEVFNEAFKPLPFVVPIDKKMMKMYEDKYLKVINPKYVVIVKKDNEIVGFMVAVPSLSVAMQKAHGRLFPFGFYHLMKAMKNPKVLDFLLGGSKDPYESQGVAVIMYAEIQKQMLQDGIKYIESTGNFETNHKIIANWKNFDHIQHKRRRVYIKDL